MRSAQEQAMMSNSLSTNHGTGSGPAASKLLRSLYSHPPFSGWESAMVRDLSRELAVLFGTVLVIAAIIGLRTWMWFPQTQG
ncbi:hypothetical protein [Bosea thiooxidans]